jgi:hypothetical protein
MDSRTYRRFCDGFRCFLSVVGPSPTPEYIPFLRDGAPISVGVGEEDRDEQSGLYRRFDVARLKDGIPNPIERPCLPLPWSLRVEVSMFPNDEVSEQDTKNLLEKGGITVGLGTYRGRFGKFAVTEWSELG